MIWTLGHILILLLVTPSIGQAQPLAPIELPALSQCRLESDTAASRSLQLQSWLARAERKDPLASFCLAYVPNGGNDATSMGWLEQAALLNLPDAQLLLATDYEVGMRFPQNFKLAMEWYHRAAEQDFPFAQFELASIYYQGRAGERPNTPEAYFWALLAARHQFLSAHALIPELEKQLPEKQRQQIRNKVAAWHQPNKTRKAS